MIEYDITLNHEQQQVLIYWCAFFVFLCIVFIEVMLFKGAKIRFEQKCKTNVNIHMKERTNIMFDGKNVYSNNGKKEASEITEWDVNKTVNMNKQTIRLETNDRLETNNNYIETEI